MGNLAGGKDPRPGPTGPRGSGIGSRPVLWAAFSFSIALHVFVVALYPLLFEQLRPGLAAFPLSTVAGSSGGLRIIRLLEINEVSELARPEEPDELEPVEEPEAQVESPSLGEGPVVVELERPGISAAERLQPNLTDPRLWAPLPPEFSELTLEEREELLVAGRLTEWYDSVAAANAAASRWTDWTFTDSEGKRWGIADGRVYLGDYSFSFGFDAAPGPQRDYLQQYEEIARQGASIRAQETVRERIDAIRARRDRERAAAQADTAR